MAPRSASLVTAAADDNDADNSYRRMVYVAAASIADAKLFGSWTNVLAMLGAAFLMYYVCLKVVPFVLQSFYIYCLGRCSRTTFFDLTQCGQWAVVTGCTDGIGRAYVDELARRGLNIVLISRNYDKLIEQSIAVGIEHRVQTKTITADFTQQDIYTKIAIQLDGLNIGVLVNNVGMGMDPEFFADAANKIEFMQSMINCNVASVVVMTGIVLPGMVERKKGAVINVSSAAGCRPVPLLALYSSTKAMINNLTEALSHEYSDKGITFQAVTPYVVSTKMSGMAERSGLIIPKPQAYVKDALRSLGIWTQTPGYLWHEIQHLVMRVSPAIVLKLFLIEFKKFAAKRGKAPLRFPNKEGHMA